MNLLLHICCGPCAIFPVSSLRQKGVSVSGYFYNPNIHPYKEFRRRLRTADEYSKEIGMAMILNKNYGLVDFVRGVVNNEDKRCSYCYRDRLEKTVQKAKDEGFEAFSTTLLYSKYQNHREIRSVCEELSKQYSLHFYYEDFRAGWQIAIDESIKRNMYRQPYCGCIYSEQERYDKNFRKNRQKK